MGYRILFMGTPDFAVPCLQALLDAGHTVVGIVTQPDRPKGRGRRLSAPPVKELAIERGIPVLQPTKIRTGEFADELRAFNADLFVVVAYGRILPASLLAIPKFGCINVHGSLLPKYRGAAPIQWAVINGDQKAGVTIMQMDEGMDTGDILFAEELEIAPQETAGTLFDKLAALGGQALTTALDKLSKGELQPTPQDHTLATTAPPLSKEMGNINWDRPAEEVHNLIRGLDPWPCASAFLDGKRFRLFSPELIHTDRPAEPGTILRTDGDGLLIATGKGALLIHEIQPEGKRRMPAEDFLRGTALQPGQRFTSP